MSINDPIARRNFAIGNQQRTFVVEDPTLAQPQNRPPQPNAPQTQPPPVQNFIQQGERSLSQKEIEEYHRMRKEQLESNSMISDYAKKRVEIITGTGSLTKDVDLDGHKFSLRTLKNKETKEAMMESIGASKNDMEAMYETRRQFLARSLFRIDDADIALVLGSSDLSTRLYFIDELEESVVDKLYVEFNNLRNEVRDKYTPKTSQEVKEVIEDIKK